MKVIAVTSGKGGAGKSCVAAYTGAALAHKGAKVLLLELGMRSLDLITGAHDRVIYDIRDVLTGKCELPEAVQPAALDEKLFLLAGGIAEATPERRRELSDKLQQMLYSNVELREYDYVILDDPELEKLPPKLVQQVLMVTTPESLCIRSCSWKVRELLKAGHKNIRLIINNVPAQVLPMHGAEDFDDVIDLIGVQLIAVIPSSPKLSYSANNAKPLSGESMVPQVYECLAGRIRGENHPLLIR